MNKIILIAVFYMIALQVNAQDSVSLPKKLTLNGYIKDLQTLNFNKNFRELITGNLVHNRINIKWKPGEKFTAVAELRSRLFWGEEVKGIPGFVALLRNENELINMQKAWITGKALVLHSNIERLYVDYRNTAFSLRIGRQRINWGITTTWNPNDIFNTYNFLDFDYEERPGVDGGKLQYQFNEFAGAELAYTNTGNKNGNIAAFKYSLNKGGYDMQLITGWYKQQLTLGTGWAGNINDAGFKGEVQYYVAGRSAASHFNLSVESDYMFKKGWYLNGSVLFNNNGLYKAVNNWDSINLKLTPQNLMPTKWNLMVAAVKEITPLLSANMSVLFAPGTNLLIFFPSMQYNLATNLDLGLFWQSFFAELNKKFGSVNHRCILRIKWSF